MSQDRSQQIQNHTLHTRSEAGGIEQGTGRNGSDSHWVVAPITIIIYFVLVHI